MDGTIGWICPKCGSVNAPHVMKCDCTTPQFVPYYPHYVPYYPYIPYVPTYPFPTYPFPTYPITTCDNTCDI